MIFLTKLFYCKSVNVFKMYINYWGTILPIIFRCHSFLIFQLHCLTIHKHHFFIVTDSSILITKLIQVIFYFYLWRRLFIFTIRLIHFWYDFYLLFNGLYCFFTIKTPGLCPDVLNVCILTRLAFLRILRGNVDCVHFY